MRPDQTPTTRTRRLRDGRCPTHGVVLKATGRIHESHRRPGRRARVEYEVACPRRVCSFTVWVRCGTQTDDALRGGRS